MIFEHNGKQYAYEQGTSQIAEYTPGEEFNDTNPPLACKPTVTNQPCQQLVLEVTQQCNLRCQYCQHTHQGIPEVRPHRDVHMTPEIAQTALDLFFANCTDDAPICFYGGEPLLELELIKCIVERYPERSYKIDTNGQLVDEDLTRWAAKYDIGWQISLDGPPAINDACRGGGSADKAISGIRLIQEHAGDKAEIRINAVLIPQFGFLGALGVWFDANLGDVDLSANIANLTGSTIRREKQDIAAMNEVMAVDKESYRYQVLMGKREELSTLVRRVHEPALISLKGRHRGEARSWIPGGCCDPGVRRLYVTATGELLPCEKVGSDCQIGDVWSGVNQSKACNLHNKFHIEHLSKGCADCWAVRLCSGCWAAEVKDCDARRSQLLDDIKLYIDLCEADQADWLRDAKVDNIK